MGDALIVESLLEAGVDPTPILESGLSPRDLAKINDDGYGSHARVLEPWQADRQADR